MGTSRTLRRLSVICILFKMDIQTAWGLLPVQKSYGSFSNFDRPFSLQYISNGHDHCFVTGSTSIHFSRCLIVFTFPGLWFLFLLFLLLLLLLLVTCASPSHDVTLA